MTIVVCSLRKGAAPVPAGFHPVRVDRQTPLGNPYPEKEHGREGCIALYRTWLHQQLIHSDSEASMQFNDLRKRLLRGENLALMCWCAPLACHANVIRELLELSASAINAKLSQIAANDT